MVEPKSVSSSVMVVVVPDQRVEVPNPRRVPVSMLKTVKLRFWALMSDTCCHFIWVQRWIHVERPWLFFFLRGCPRLVIEWVFFSKWIVFSERIVLSKWIVLSEWILCQNSVGILFLSKFGLEKILVESRSLSWLSGVRGLCSCLCGSRVREANDCQQ